MAYRSTNATRTDVAILGGGPVGLSAAIALGRLGITTTVLERRPTTSRHPKAHFENARTMELFRIWGIDSDVRARGLPPEWLTGAAFVTTLAGYELGAIRWDEDPGYLERSASLGPAPPSSTPQDLVEPILKAMAESLATVTVCFDARVIEIEQSANGVSVHIENEKGVRSRVEATWAIAADGANSSVREMLGVPASGPGAAGTQLGIYFHADLARWTARRPYVLYWIYNARLSGVLIALDGKERWHLLFPYDAATESPADYTPERCAELVAAGVVGDANCPVDVKSVLPWRMQILTADRFRDGRVLFIGDAAHAMPPTGGLGLNSGVGDAHNLAWKLAAVIRGDAENELLDTYEAERRPVAIANAQYSMDNATKMAETGLAGILSHDPRALETVELPAGERVRSELSAAIPLQKEQFYFDGATFGYCYDSDAVLLDDSAPIVSSTADYRKTTRPGARAPHFWLRQDGGFISTIDLSDGCFLILTGPDGAKWREAAASIPEMSFPLRVQIVAGPEDPSADLIDETGEWAALYELEPGGAVLIRPDGHVGWRSVHVPDDPQGELARALGQILGHQRSRLTTNTATRE